MSLLLEDSVAVVYALTSGCVVIGTTLNLGIVFVPKVLTQLLSYTEALLFLDSL